jgi:prepilin-type N-terminal cleavage/methylation domain-containing protein
MTASSTSAGIHHPKRRRRRGASGFTLTELAMVMLIIGLLLGSLMYTLSGQTEARNFSETQRRLEDARNLLLAYAVVHGRLPCPAVDAPSSDGAEKIDTAAGTGTGGACTATYNGFLPAVTIGYKPTDSSGFGLDPWGGRLRYAVSRTPAGFFTGDVALKAGWSGTSPSDIDICKHLTAANAANCGASANRVVSSGTVVAVIWSTGKNYAAGAASIDEGTNTDAFAAFVSRTPSPAGAGDGEFDDQLTWITVGELYGRLISAAKLP